MSKESETINLKRKLVDTNDENARKEKEDDEWIVGPFPAEANVTKSKKRRGKQKTIKKY